MKYLRVTETKGTYLKEKT
uniref:Uncharacterized protein n=1 Tax=Anguilla anguilla TaxID=7936 RepID=A0A0E9SBF9_ANGAN